MTCTHATHGAHPIIGRFWQRKGFLTGKARRPILVALAIFAVTVPSIGDAFAQFRGGGGGFGGGGFGRGGGFGGGNLGGGGFGRGGWRWRRRWPARPRRLEWPRQDHPRPS